MSRKFLVPLNLAPFASDPATGVEGDAYFNTTTNKVRLYFNDTWNDVSGSESSDEIFYQTAAPSTPSLGDVWIDSDFDVDPSLIAANDVLPSQTGNAGKYLSTDGTDATWQEIDLSGIDLSGLDLSGYATTTDLSDHESATTSVHGITDTANLVYTSDSRLSDARTPTAHASSHGSAGSDPITIAQSQVTNLSTDLSAKAPLDSPTFTGTPSAPTASAGTNSTQIATTAYADTAAANAAANLVDSAPATLDTLNELAAALGDDPNFATTIATSLSGKEPTITAGTTSQYWRGDKSWQTLDKSAVGLGNVENTALSTWTGSSSITTVGTLTNLSVTNTISGSISGNAATVTNGVYTTGTYANPSWLTELAWTKITSTPTTLSGYGISDAQPLDADLTSIAGLTGTSGILKKTAANTWSLDTSTYLTANQTITLTGDVSGSGTTSISVTVEDDSHNHIISNIDGLQTALDGKEPTITSGTTSQYWRGDKSWQTLDKSAVGLSNVENTALSTWTGTANITTVGTISTGVWQGSVVSATYIDTAIARLASPTFTGTVTTAAATTSGASINIPHGTAPTTPVNGDIWTTTSGIIARINGVTRTIASDATTSLPSLVNLASNTGAITVTIGNGATTNGTTKIINIGGNGVSGSTTTINIGSSVSGATSTTALHGVVSATTPSAGTNTTQIATTAFVRTEISNLIDSAPTTLDTLNELAAALGNDPNFATTVTTALGGKEPTIAAGTVSQYWRGDKSWQTLDKSAVGLSNVENTALSTWAGSSSITTVGTLIDLTVTNTITGSISGNAATVTNGVYTTGSYSNPSWITSLAWTKISSTPTSLSGYGITDAQPLDADLTAIAALTGTSGFLKKTAADTWTLDTSTYLTTTTASSTYAPLNSPTFTGTVDFTGATVVGLSSGGSLPSQTGNGGKFLTTDGSTASWASVTKTTVGLSNVENTALSTWAGSTNITTLGTIATGTWQGSTISATYIDTAIARLASPTFTGTPAAPTAAADTNTTQIATTAYVVGQGYLKSSTASSTYQPLDGDLTAIAALSGTSGLLKKTAADTWTLDTTSYAPTASPTFTGTPLAPTAAVDTNTTQIATTAYVVGQGYLKSATATSTYAPLASPTFTGTPLSTTAAVDTNTTQIATTAFVLGQASASNPVMDGTVAIGTSTRYARADHVHPSDTTKANLASPTFTGTPLAPTAAVDTNTTQIATTAYVIGQGYLKSSTASSTYAPLASPTFTGTITAAGLSVTGTLDIAETREAVVDVTLSSNVGTLDFTSGNVYYIATAPTANMTFNATNVPTDNSKIVNLTVMVTQGSTGYLPTTFQIGGSAQTIRWSGGAAPTPTSGAGKIDIFSFSLQRTSGGSWIVYGTSMTNF